MALLRPQPACSKSTPARFRTGWAIASGWLCSDTGLSTVSKPFLYFANSWGWVLGVRFGDRAGKGIRTAPRDALVAASTDEKSRGLAFGLHRAGDTAGAFHRDWDRGAHHLADADERVAAVGRNLPDGGAGQHCPGGFGGDRPGIGSERGSGGRPKVRNRCV